VILFPRRRCVEIGRSLGFAVLTIILFGACQSTLGHAETKIIPSAIARGQYDTNVFNRPEQFLPVGTQTSDFITTVGGAVQLLHETRDIEANLKLGGNYNVFVENTALNFFSTTVDGIVGLDRWVDQYVRGAKLRVIEHFRYTPESPGFLTGVREQTIVEPDGFLRGIQGFRANTFMNTTAISGSYPLSRDLSLEAGYTFALRRIGRIQGGRDIVGVSFFDTNSHTWFGGPRYQLTRNDSIAAVYRQSYILQSRSEGGRSFSTNLVTLAGDYSKSFQEWSFTVEGGVTFIEPAGRTTPTGSIHVRTAPERDTVVTFTVSREARPSFFLQGGATISNLGRVGISHRIYERLIADGSVAYAYNELFPSTDRTFKNFSASSTLSYKLTKDITGSLFYHFTNIDSDSATLLYQFSRHQVGLALTTEWK
jgi:hypothetical protein